MNKPAKNLQFEVQKYSIENLIARFLDYYREISPIVVRRKLQNSYFESYFKELRAETFLIEHKYVDHDFMDDYAAYYVKCFKDYDKTCKRLHFFGVKFDDIDLNKLITSDKSAKITPKMLQDNYLGFIILKPLPRTFIGRTCLKTYGSDNNRRFFPITRKYEVHIFGIVLTVDSLPYQEQDSVAGACATSALWTAFQATGLLFQHQIPTPSEITRASQKDIPIDSRIFPSNRGLTYNAMARAIQYVGLEPEIRKVDNECLLKIIVYSYLTGKIPVVMGADLYDTTQNKKPLAKHGITITGFSLGGKSSNSKKYEIVLKSSRIDRIYAHDDQVGPFSRLVFGGAGIDEKNFSLITTWRNGNGEPKGVVLVPDKVLIPLYNKIRIQVDSVIEEIQAFDQYIRAVKKLEEGIIEEKDKIFTEDIEWDIYLTHNSKFKEEIRDAMEITADEKYAMLIESMPKFIWRAKAYIRDKLLFEFLFDSTGLEQSNFCLRVVEYDKYSCEYIRLLAKTKSVKGEWEMKRTWRTLQQFI